MPTTPLAHQQYDILPMCHKIGGEGYSYSPDMENEIRGLLPDGESVISCDYDSYEEFDRQINDYISQYGTEDGKLNRLGQLLAKYKWEVVIGNRPRTGIDIFDIFRCNKNDEIAGPMSAYMRNRVPFLGILTPRRKELSRRFFKFVKKTDLDWEFVCKCWRQSEREFQYLAKDYLARQKENLTAADIPRLRELAVQKSWWDTIDGLDVIVGDIALRFPEVNTTVLDWSIDDNFWLRRIAIDHQLYRKAKTDAELLERIIVNNFEQTEFFINKAIGWSLREYSKTNPDWVRSFINRHKDRMASLSKKEASKYI